MIESYVLRRRSLEHHIVKLVAEESVEHRNDSNFSVPCRRTTQRYRGLGYGRLLVTS